MIILFISNFVSRSPNKFSLALKYAISTFHTTFLHDLVLINLCFIIITRSNPFHVRFEVFTAVTMKNGVFWDVMPRGSCKNRRFGGT
jgi:hypothetical protein